MYFFKCKLNIYKTVTPSKQMSVTDLSNTTMSVSNTSEPIFIKQNTATRREAGIYSECVSKVSKNKNPPKKKIKWEEKTYFLCCWSVQNHSTIKGYGGLIQRGGNISIIWWYFCHKMWHFLPDRAMVPQHATRPLDARSAGL